MPATLTLRSQVRARRQQLADVAATTADAGDEAGADDQATAGAGNVEPDVDVDEPVDDTAAAATDNDSEQQSA
jgi:hypothetical protein